MEETTAAVAAVSARDARVDGEASVGQECGQAAVPPGRARV